MNLSVFYDIFTIRPSDRPADVVRKQCAKLFKFLFYRVSCPTLWGKWIKGCCFRRFPW